MRARPVNRVIAQLILGIGQFEKTSDNEWSRKVDEEGYVKAVLSADALIFSLGPAISSPMQHALHRVSAGVMFEMAWRYAEKVDGEVWQLATISGCRPSEANSQIYLARFPEEQFSWNKICPGFQAVILGGAPA